MKIEYKIEKKWIGLFDITTLFTPNGSKFIESLINPTRRDLSLHTNITNSSVL